MKTLSLETCKRLQEKGLLDNIETEGTFLLKNGNPYFVEEYKGQGNKKLKAPNLEEAIELLPQCIFKDGNRYFISIHKASLLYTIYYSYYSNDFRKVGKTLLEAVENMINYLLDNNLI